MSDDVAQSGRPIRGGGEDDALEQELRALFAPVPAPPAFRSRLKAELLEGDKRLVYLHPPVDRPDDRVETSWMRRGWIHARLLGTHPRAAALSGAVALVAALLLAATLSGLLDKLPIVRSTVRPSAPITLSPTLTVVPAPTARRPLLPARPTPLPRAFSRQTAQPRNVPPPLRATPTDVQVPVASPTRYAGAVATRAAPLMRTDTAGPVATPVLAGSYSPPATATPPGASLTPTMGSPSATVAPPPATATAPPAAPTTAPTTVPATVTSMPPTATPLPATATALPATAVPASATAAPLPATTTPLPLTATPLPATATPAPPAPTRPAAPTATTGASGRPVPLPVAPRATATAVSPAFSATALTAPGIRWPSATPTPLPSLTRPTGRSRAVRGVAHGRARYWTQKRPSSGPPLSPAAVLALIRGSATPTPAPTTTPRPSVTSSPTRTPLPRPTMTPIPTATARPTRRPTMMPAATTTPTARPTRRPTTTPVSTATATVRPTARLSATLPPTETPAPPSATSVPASTATLPPTPTVLPLVLNPLAQAGPPVPNNANGILDSPLSGTLATAQQPVYAVPVSWTLALPLATLPVYAVATMPVTATDLLAVARMIGVQSVLTPPEQSADGGIAATVELDNAAYTLAVYAGYGMPRFSVRAMHPAVGILSSARVVTQAASWLQAHHLQYPDLRLLTVHDSAIDFGQSVDTYPLLGPTVLHLSFDGRGALRDLSDAYIVPRSTQSWPLQPPDIAASAAVAQGQGLYQGPATTVITGAAAISSIALAYVGVHGTTDYVEPVYVLNGTVPTTTGLQPFALYVSALQYATASAPLTPQPPLPQGG